VAELFNAMDFDKLKVKRCVRLNVNSKQASNNSDANAASGLVIVELDSNKSVYEILSKAPELKNNIQFNLKMFT
jgi:hypothetical protein